MNFLDVLSDFTFLGVRMKLVNPLCVGHKGDTARGVQRCRKYVPIDVIRVGGLSLTDASPAAGASMGGRPVGAGSVEAAGSLAGPFA